MRQPEPALADVLDVLAPYLDHRGRCALQATCTTVRKAGMHSEVVNWKIDASPYRTVNHVSFLLWLEPRSHVVRRLIYGCSQSSLPEQLWGLTALQALKLGCHYDDPSSMQSALDKLQYANGVAHLPAEMGQLTTLQTLHLGDSRELQQLPPEIGQLSWLQMLDLRGCLALQELPAKIGQLAALQTLYLYNCEALKELPAEIGQLTALQMLNLRGCEALTHLPAEIGQLTALQWLDLSGCEALTQLPFYYACVLPHRLQRGHLRCCRWRHRP